MRTFLIGLGGSGIEVVTRLQKLREQRLLDVASEEERRDLRREFDKITSVVIDTDSRDLPKCKDLGITAIRISSSGSVGAYINELGKDVREWCPDTKADAAFISSKVDTGASQVRMKSRLCLAGFLKDELNPLTTIFDDVQRADGELGLVAPRITIISSIAGGTGSGIFIQIALYIKRYFRREFNQDVVIHGIFACPDLYKAKVEQTEWKNIYSNAYAVVRELNAFNIVYGNAAVPGYGNNIQIKLDSQCEGNLFSPDQEGLYGHKPYDHMYFIDKVNALGGLNAGINTYYDIMAKVAFAIMFTPVNGQLDSSENNELINNTNSPLSIYGSAGAATMEYPYDDILKYLSAKYAKDSVSDIWTVFDKRWHNYVRQKEISERAKGALSYSPEPGERGQQFIREFANTVFGNTLDEENRKFSFLRHQIPLRKNTTEPAAVYSYMETLRKEALHMVQDDSFLQRTKDEKGITDAKIDSVTANIAELLNSRDLDDKENLFAGLLSLDDGVSCYAEACADKIEDFAQVLATKILCTEPALWEDYESSSCNIVNGLLKHDHAMVHPLAVRYLLYHFAEALQAKRRGVSGSQTQTTSESLRIFKEDLFRTAKAQKLMYDPDTSDADDITNERALEKLYTGFIGFLGGRAKAAALLRNDYPEKTKKHIELIEETVRDAILYFAFELVLRALTKLITQYELFFDKIEAFQARLEKDIVKYQDERNEPGSITVYVGASREKKEELYKSLSMRLNPDSGEVAASISSSLFNSVRESLWAAKNKTSSQVGISAFFDSVSENISRFLEDNQEIKQSIDKDIISALLDDYAAENGRDDITHFRDDQAAGNKVLSFIEKKLRDLVVRGTPMLTYDVDDTYACFYADLTGQGPRDRKSHPYRFLELSPVISQKIHSELYYQKANPEEAVEQFLIDCSDELPKEQGFLSTHLRMVENKYMSHRVINYVSAVHCLQPYQIPKFDELRNGDYYKYYKLRMEDVYKTGKLSNSPHLDKRWHKRGMMPYVNFQKERDVQYMLAKAFVYAVLYSKIQCLSISGVRCVQYEDPKMNRSAMLLRYQGMPITNFDFAKILYWLMDEDVLIEAYAQRFDLLLDRAVRTVAAKFTGDIRQYEQSVTTCKFVKVMRESILSTTTFSLQNKEKKALALKPFGILKLAGYVKESEESTADHDFAEDIIDVAEEVLVKFAAAPFNENLIVDKTTTEASQFEHVLRQQRKKFMESYCEAETERRRIGDAKDATSAEPDEQPVEPDVNKEETEEEEEEVRFLGDEFYDDNADDSGRLVDNLPDDETKTAYEALTGFSVAVTDSSEYKWLDEQFSPQYKPKTAVRPAD